MPSSLKTTLISLTVCYLPPPLDFCWTFIVTGNWILFLSTIVHSVWSPSRHAHHPQPTTVFKSICCKSATIAECITVIPTVSPSLHNEPLWNIHSVNIQFMYLHLIDWGMDGQLKAQVLSTFLHYYWSARNSMPLSRMHHMIQRLCERLAPDHTLQYLLFSYAMLW